MAVSDWEIITRRIRESVDIVEVVGSYVTLRRAGANFKGLCPFHNEKTPSFNVHPGLQIFKCYGCGAGGDVFKFLQMRENVDFREARRMLAERAGISLEADRPSGAGVSAGPGKSDLVRVNDWAQAFFRRQYEGPAGEAARAYVAGRGISVDVARDFGIGLALDRFEGLIEEARKVRIAPSLLVAAGLVKESDRGGLYDTFRHRLMFPIHDVTGRIIGFGGRTLGNDQAKYLNTPATSVFDKSANLFAIDRAKHTARESGRIVVVEGYTDCIMAHQGGFTETVATLGTAMTDAHASLIRRFCDRVVLVFDSDDAGQKAADRAISVTLTHGLDVTLAKVPAGKDPCDYLVSAGAEAFGALLKNGTGALEFKWEEVSRAYDASVTGPARRRAIESFLAQLAAWGGHGVIDPIQRGLLINQLSKVLSVPAEDLHRQLRRLMRRTTGGRVGQPAPVAGNAGLSAGPMITAAELLAQRHMVEALLNDAGQYAQVAGRFDLGALRDSALCAVGRELEASLAGGEPFDLASFIGRFESPEFGRLITDLQQAGERRGRYAEVVEGALAFLEACTLSRQALTLADQIRSGRQRAGVEARAGGGVQAEGKDRQADETDSLPTGEDAGTDVPPGEDERLLALTAHAKRSHFSPASVRKRFLQS